MYAPKPSHLRVALAALVAAMLVACLWPFNFRPSNQVEWLEGEPGVRFTGMGQIVSWSGFPSLLELSEDNSLTIEIAIRPATLQGHSLAHILSFQSAHDTQALILGSWKGSLILRLGLPGIANGTHYRETGVPEALAIRQTSILTVITGAQGTTCYLDGNLRRTAPTVRLTPNASPLGRLLLGASSTGGGTWQGDITGLRIFGRSLTESEVQRSVSRLKRGEVLPETLAALIASYPFKEASGTSIKDATNAAHDLIIPTVFRPLRPTVFASPLREFRWRRSYLLDLLLNILGFIPLAYLTMHNLRASWRPDDRAGLAITLFACLMFSLAIELVQALLPTRTSSLTDVGANTLGGMLGAILACAITRKPQKDY